jgi:hypothetical protein
MRVPCPPRLVPLYLIIWRKVAGYEDPHYAAFSSLILFIPSWEQRS